jgi:hypothetical protein
MTRVVSLHVVGRQMDLEFWPLLRLEGDLIGLVGLSNQSRGALLGRWVVPPVDLAARVDRRCSSTKGGAVSSASVADECPRRTNGIVAF